MAQNKHLIIRLIELLTEEKKVLMSRFHLPNRILSGIGLVPQNTILGTTQIPLMERKCSNPTDAAGAGAGQWPHYCTLALKFVWLTGRG